MILSLPIPTPSTSWRICQGDKILPRWNLTNSFPVLRGFCYTPPAPTTPSTRTVSTSEGGGWSGLRTLGESKLFSEQLVRGEIGRCCIEIRPRPVIQPTY